MGAGFLRHYRSMHPCRNLGPRLALPLLLLGTANGQPTRTGSALGYVNLDFEAGRRAWRVWYSDDRNYTGPRFKYGPDTDVHRGGDASMRIEATNPAAQVFVNQTTDQFRPGVRYELTYFVRVSSPVMAENCGILLNLRRRRAGGKTRMTGQIKPVMSGRKDDDGWIYRRGYFAINEDADLVQLGMYVRDTEGTVWFDDIHIKEVKKEGSLYIDSMYDYSPEQVELGQAMVRRFKRLVRSRSPFLDRAEVYNQLLVDSAFLAESGRRLFRCAYYLRGKGEPPDLTQERAAVREVESKLDELYKTYGRLFETQRIAGLIDFDEASDVLDVRITSALQSFAKKRDVMQLAARSAGQNWTVPPTPKAKDVVINPDGKPNQIVFATRSRVTHFDLEAPLTINRLHTVRMHTPSQTGTGEYSFRPVLDQWSRLESLGATQASIATPFAIHGKQVTPAWFRRKYATDPDILMSAADGAWPQTSDSDWPLNTWRPEVREMTVDLVTQLGNSFREMPQFLWYVTAPENIGPYFRAGEGKKTGYRSTGYNRSALPDFHAWLRQRYKTITELNRQWRTDYGDFPEIRPPTDLCLVGEWERPHPLAYEFQSWRVNRHIDWQKLIYDTLKEADPTKPVFASHSRLLASLDGSRLFETTDIMGYHQEYPHFLLGTIYTHSLNRFAKKQLGQYECFWGCQEDLKRIAEERIQRRALMKYLYRLTVWGRHIQVWSYAYTHYDYLLRYNANWFNPVYDLTTLRYCAAALPVGQSKVKRLEPVFLNTTLIPSRVTLLQPNTSMLFQVPKRGESYLEMLQLHDLLFSNNQLYELIPESYFVDGRARFDHFDVVILPYAPFFPDSLAEQLGAWVKNGGLLIAAGPFGLYDKFGFDKADLWTDVFGRVPTRLTRNGPRGWQWAMEGKHDHAWLDKPYGKGRVISTLHSFRHEKFRKVAGLRILHAVENAAPPPVTCASQDFEMTLHQGLHDQRYLCVLNRNVDRPVEDTVILAGRFTRGIDLDVPGGFPIPFHRRNGSTSFTLRLAPGEFTVIALEQ